FRQTMGASTSLPPMANPRCSLQSNLRSCLPDSYYACSGIVTFAAGSRLPAAGKCGSLPGIAPSTLSRSCCLRSSSPTITADALTDGRATALENSITMKQPLVYIIILNYNGLRWLEGCLIALSITRYENYRLIVVDNASTDGSLEILRTRFPEIEV